MTGSARAGSGCPVVVRGAIVYKDDDHITASFSRAEGPVLGERILEAVRGLRPWRFQTALNSKGR